MRKFSIVLVVLTLLALAVVPVFAQGTIADLAAATPDLSTLLAAVQAADPAVAAALSGEGPLTVFAPNNLAFANLNSFLAENYNLSLDAVLADQELLTQILLYHVVQGNVFSNQLSTGTVPTLLPGTAIGVEVSDEGVVLNSVANVVAADIEASNGVVHIIDQVILPGFILAQLDEIAIPDGFGRVRVAHLAAARAVDVYVDGAQVASRVQPGDVTPWANIASGLHTVVVTAAGGDPATEAILGPLELDVAIDSWTTVAAIGAVTTDAQGVRQTDDLEALVIAENFAELAETDARVVIVHGISDAPPVNVTSDGTVVARGLRYGQTASLDVFGGTYDLAVVARVAGADLTLFDLAGTELAAGTYYFVAAAGSLSDPELVVVTTDQETIDALLAEVPAAEGQ